MTRLGRFYASREGGIIAQLLGAAMGDPAGARLVPEQFFAPAVKPPVTSSLAG